MRKELGEILLWKAALLFRGEKFPSLGFHSDIDSAFASVEVGDFTEDFVTLLAQSSAIIQEKSASCRCFGPSVLGGSHS